MATTHESSSQLESHEQHTKLRDDKAVIFISETPHSPSDAAPATQESLQGGEHGTEPAAPAPAPATRKRKDLSPVAPDAAANAQAQALKRTRTSLEVVVIPDSDDEDGGAAGASGDSSEGHKYKRPALPPRVTQARRSVAKRESSASTEPSTSKSVAPPAKTSSHKRPKGETRDSRDVKPSKSGVPVNVKPASPGSPAQGSKGKGKAKQEVTLSSVLAEVDAKRLGKSTMSKEVQDLVACKTISDAVRFLNVLPRDAATEPQGPLSGKRVCLVNASSSGNNKVMGKITFFALKTIVLLGATLVSPDEFVPSPSEADLDDPSVAVQAEREMWTSHVVHDSSQSNPPPHFSDMLGCLRLANDPKVKLTPVSVGPYAHFVRYDWILQCKSNRHAVQEALHEVSGDTRAQELVQPSRLRTPSVGAHTTQTTTSGGGGGARARRSVSPFNELDMPFYERPDSHVAHPSKRRRTVSVASSGAHTNVVSDSQGSNSTVRPLDSPMGGAGAARQRTPATPDPPLALGQPQESPLARVKQPQGSPEGSQSTQRSSMSKYEGLEQEMKKLNDHPALLDLLEQDDFAIISTAVDDNLTEEEENAESDDGTPKQKKKMQVTPTKRKQKDGPKYMCDQPSAHQTGVPENARLVEVMEELAESAERMEGRNGNPFRAQGYRRAAAIFRKYDKPVTSYQQLIQIRGIGESIALKAIEILKTGTHRRITQASEPERVGTLLTKIYGVGSAIADDWCRLGIRSIEDVRARKNGLVLSSQQEIGLRYYEDLLQRIPRHEVAQIGDKVKTEAARIDAKLEVHVMGSFRRGAADSGDVDLLITRETSDGKSHAGKIRKLLERLFASGVIRHTLSEPDDWDALDAKWMGLCQLAGCPMRRLDILGVPHDELPAALIYFTGNDFFNRSMRLKARHLGYSLNQRGLYENLIRDKKGNKITEGTRVPCATEEDIFNTLKVKWIPPHERQTG